MKKDFSMRWTGGCFVAAALMLWGGWMALPHAPGDFFEAADFELVYGSFTLWIWTFRVHLFGMVVTVMALVALASLLVGHDARVMVWPGVAVAAAGTLVGALGAAFYYHHGAWGALDLHGKSDLEVRGFVEAIRLDTEYVTCLVRFSRVFSGLGLLVLGAALIRWRILPVWLGSGAVAIGLAAMGLTMLLPDHMSLYLPVFHIHSLWLFATGLVILRSGLHGGS